MFIEDYIVGERAEIGSYTFAADEIIRFAEEFDPQPFHLSEEGGAAGPFGKLAASGWHTCAVWMKLMIAFQVRTAKERIAAGLDVGRAGPSPGFRELKWKLPVFAGDTLTYFAETIEARPSASRPGWGVLTARQSAVKQDGAEAFSFVCTVMVERRAKG